MPRLSCTPAFAPICRMLLSISYERSLSFSYARAMVTVFTPTGFRLTVAGPVPGTRPFAMLRTLSKMS